MIPSAAAMLRDTKGAMKRAVSLLQSLLFGWIQSRRLPRSLTPDCEQEHIKGAPVSQTPTITHIHSADMEAHKDKHAHTRGSTVITGFTRSTVTFHSLHTAHDIYSGDKISERLIPAMKMMQNLSTADSE